jgi:hypothetical protein
VQAERSLRNYSAPGLALPPVDFDTITEASYWALGTTVIVVPLWLVLFPPHRVCARSLFFRWLLAVLATQALVYVLFYSVIYPVVDAYAQAHPNSLLDGITLFPPWLCSLGAAIVASLVLAVRATFFKLRDLIRHDAPGPRSPNA